MICSPYTLTGKQTQNINVDGFALLKIKQNVAKHHAFISQIIKGKVFRFYTNLLEYGVYLTIRKLHCN